MTKQEFISNQQAYKNISGKGAVIAVSLVVGFGFFIVGIMVLISVIRDHLKTAWIADSVTAVITIALFCFVLVCYQLFVRSVRLRMFKLGLICTGCGSPLVGAASRADITKGSCRRCSKTFLDETPDV